MDESDWLANRFEEQRTHLRGVAYRMLGSPSEADDAVQEAWLHLSRSDTSGIENLGGWLTTVAARVCLDILRSRKSRREESRGAHIPEPVVSRGEVSNPEFETLQADSVGLALLVVLETLAPTERVAFVLHDMFGVPFDEIAPLSAAPRLRHGRSRAAPAVGVQGATTVPDADHTRQREVVNAFLAASRGGDFDALDMDFLSTDRHRCTQISSPDQARAAGVTARRLFETKMREVDRWRPRGQSASG